ncbi:MAG: helix-turn-helix domain-containing protein [Acidobacteriaceae bacterium]|nr:helix-turn-helix domain-containing protein [Acidobacteriaceae bacterium]
MRIDYSQTIRQNLKQLEKHEQQLRGTALASRARLLRLLKTRQACSLPEASRLLGYSTVQVTRWWACYRQRGRRGLLQPPTRPGRPWPRTAEAWRGLQQEMRAGRMTRREDVRPYWHHRWQIHYASVNGVWHLLRQRRVQFKTGRRRHQPADSAAQAAFQKTLDAYGKGLV